MCCSMSVHSLKKVYNVGQKLTVLFVFAGPPLFVKKIKINTILIILLNYDYD